MRRSIVVAVVMVMLVLAGGGGPARAGVEDEVTKAFGGFVDGVAAGKPLPKGLELFTTPISDDALPESLAPVRAMLPASKVVKVVALVPSASGKSAWLAAEISALVTPSGEKPRADVLRATAVLSLEGGAWVVKAAHWSVAQKNVKPEMCGDMGDSWEMGSAVPLALTPAVVAVLEALDSGKPARFVALMSDDKRAQVFGSAPKETFVGGKKIKGIFKKWSVEMSFWEKDDPTLPARAGVTADGELMWMATTVAYYRLCVSYRALFVMAKEKGAWKIIHQHYSEPIWVDSDE
jgi:hypothetical protein